MDKDNLLKDIYMKLEAINFELLEVWKATIVFNWRWWLELVLSLIPWIIWIKCRDRKDTVRLLFVGLVVMIVTDFSDLLGACFGLWRYDWKLLPFIAIYIPWNFTLFPILIMSLLQFKKTINPLIKSILFGALCAFVFEPLFTLIGLYRQIKWRHHYSFVLYIVLYLLFNKLYNSKLFEPYSTPNQ